MGTRCRLIAELESNRERERQRETERRRDRERARAPGLATARLPGCSDRGDTVGPRAAVADRGDRGDGDDRPATGPER